MEKIEINVGNVVKVTSMTDETANGDFIGMMGEVIELNTNGATGNIETDPLYRVKFKLGQNEDDFVIEDFWHEELTLLYWQPEFKNDDEMIQNDFYSFQVYSKLENANKDFPKHNIIMYSGGDIEEPTFVDLPESFS